MRSTVTEFFDKQHTHASRYTLALQPESPDETIYPGCTTLSYSEVAYIVPVLLSTYTTTLRKGDVPSSISLLKDLAWFNFLLALEAELIVRQQTDDQQAVEILEFAISHLLDHQNPDTDTVTEACDLLSTFDVLDKVSLDLLHLAYVNRLTLSFSNEDRLSYHTLPRGGFSSIGAL